MNILFSTPTSKQYIGCPQVSEQQIVCGPSWENETNEHGYVSLRTPQGVYDLKQSIATLSQEEQPDMVVVWADSSMTNGPCNLNQFSCPRILLVGDTHHLQMPLQKLISYAKSEPFDMVITINNRQHAHFFVEAGIKNMYWLPGFGAQVFPLDFQEKRDSRFVFVGQVGKFHPRRVRLIPQIVEAKLPLVVGQLPAIKAAEAYSTSLGSFHCSLNGDMSFRNFEVLSSGGFLLADRLSEQSGMSLLFQEDKHLASYGSLGELREKMEYFLSKPQRALEIARNGYEEFWRNHSPQKKREEFLRLVLNREINPLYDLMTEKRIAYFSVENSSMLDRRRVEAFEFIQELHRREEVISVTCGGGNPELLCDMADLPRVRLNIIKTPETMLMADVFEKTGVNQSISWLTPDEFFTHSADVWLLTTSELTRAGIDRILHQPVLHIILFDCQPEEYQLAVQLLKQADFVPEKQNSLVFHRQEHNENELQSEIVRLGPWQQAIELPGGIVTPGRPPMNRQSYRLEQINFTGRRVLDVGASDGYWTFIALQAGAKQVVAIDDRVSGSTERFELCRRAFGYSEEQCTRISQDIYEINPETLGTFDIVLFFGQIYQLRHPLLALDRLSSVCTGELYMESFLLDDFSPAEGQIKPGWTKKQAAMEVLSGQSVVSGWLPTLHCLGYMVRSAGFADVQGWKVTNSPRQLNDCHGFIKGCK